MVLRVSRTAQPVPDSASAQDLVAAFHWRSCRAVMVSASEQPALGSGVSTVRSGARILAVSAMKYTPANTMTRAVLAAASRDSASESPT